MKNMICVVLFSVCAWAQAEEWLEAANQDGGSIILMDAPCGDRFPKLKMMMTMSSGGRATYGCWTYFTGRVQVTYLDGATYAYDPDIFIKKSSDGGAKSRDLLSYPKFK